MTASVPVAARHGLQTLRVSRIEQLTDDSVAITFEIPTELAEVFRFLPGQHVALARPGAGDGVRRSYSICSPAGGSLRVAVKRLPGGAFSSWVHGSLRVGDQLDVLPPVGRFTADLDPCTTHCYVAIAAGSGITPVFSIVASVLAVEPRSRCTLVYGSRTIASIMFLEELEDLKNQYRDRLHLIHVLSREPQEIELAYGRIDRPKLDRLLEALLPVGTVDGWFLCGPAGLIQTAQAMLTERGVDARNIHRELFHANDAPGPSRLDQPAEVASGDATVTIVLDGRSATFTAPRNGRSILDAALAVRPDAPYACKGGVCGTCRCQVLEGSVRMDHAYALEDAERSAGVVLACQSHPVTELVTLDFDVG